MGCAIFWVILLLTHLVTLPTGNVKMNLRKLANFHAAYF
jgi:hypothetical protein